MKKIIGAYLFFGGLVCLALVFSQMSFFKFWSFFLPALISVVIMLIPIVAGAVNLFSGQSKAADNLVFVSLIIQTFQFSIVGFIFVNYFGPFIALGITDNPSLSTTFEFRPLSYRAMNGYLTSRGDSTISVNLVPVALLVVFFYGTGPNNDKRNESSAMNTQ